MFPLSDNLHINCGIMIQDLQVYGLFYSIIRMQKLRNFWRTLRINSIKTTSDYYSYKTLWWAKKFTEVLHKLFQVIYLVIDCIFDSPIFMWFFKIILTHWGRKWFDLVSNDLMLKIRCNCDAKSTETVSFSFTYDNIMYAVFVIILT